MPTHAPGACTLSRSAVTESADVLVASKAASKRETASMCVGRAQLSRPGPRRSPRSRRHSRSGPAGVGGHRQSAERGVSLLSPVSRPFSTPRPSSGRSARGAAGASSSLTSRPTVLEARLDTNLRDAGLQVCRARPRPPSSRPLQSLLDGGVLTWKSCGPTAHRHLAAQAAHPHVIVASRGATAMTTHSRTRGPEGSPRTASCNRSPRPPAPPRPSRSTGAGSSRRRSEAR